MNSKPAHSGVPREILHFPKGQCEPGEDGTYPCVATEFSDQTVEVAKQLANDTSQARVRSGKIVVIGDVGVGKTSLIHRFCKNSFNTDYKATIGVDFEVEAFSILGLPFHLQIWDTAGQERFRSLAVAYYRGADCLVVAYDISDDESLESGKKWYEEALSAIGPKVPVFLVATKRDKLESCGEEKTLGQEMAKHIGAEYWVTSSATGQGVNEMFHKIAAVTFEENLRAAAPPPSQGLTLDREDIYEENKKKLCRCVM